MKKIPQNEVMHLSPVSIYWDCLQEIVERVKREREVEIRSGEYIYESLDELKEKTQKKYITQIEILGRGIEKRDDYIKVDINPTAVFIFQDVESTETAAKVKELLLKNSPWFMYSSNSILWHILEGTLWMITIFTIIVAHQVDSVYIKGVVTLGGIGIILWGLKSQPIFGRTKIFTSLRKDKSNFWESNGNSIVRGGVLTIIGAFLGAFLDALFTHWFSK